MRKKIYQLHRRLSIIIAAPVLLWAISGFMHPTMTNIRPAIATQGIPPTVVDSARLRYPLTEALQKHHMDSVTNVRLVHIDTNWFYQVQPARGDVPVYLSCTNGNVLTAGDWLYAQYLARQFLEGPTQSTHASMSPEAHAHMNQVPPAHLDPTVHFASSTTAVHDCCGAATETVLNPVKGAKVANVSLVRTYNKEYKSINRLLPVYCVSFERPDGIRIYVETTQDRFSFAMDNRRAIFDEIFRLCHTWGWLDFLGKGRLAVEVLVALTALLTTILGIYIFFTTRAAKAKGNGLVTARRNHRWTAIVASLFTLMWTFSGSFHAFSKFSGDPHDQQRTPDRFAAASTAIDWPRLTQACPRPITNISLVQMAGVTYWRAVLLPQHIAAHKDLMKDAKTAMTPVAYVRTSDYTVLENGDAKYAAELSTAYSGHRPEDILSTTPVTSFSDEYNFTDKRLPVWKVSYAANAHERLYIETGTGKLASRVNDRSVVEGYSFALFHKHHFMDWAGKSVRDASTMFWVFVQVVMASFGLMLWFRRRRR